MRRIVLAMALLLVCGSVWAVGGDMGADLQPLTDGSAAYPYLIEDLADFDEFAGDSSYWASGVHTKLAVDIDLSGRTYPTAVIAYNTDGSSVTWDGTPFTGTFDGNGHTISTLTVNGVYYCGLFGYIDSGGSIMNLGLENVSITGSGSGVYVGGLAGLSAGSVTSSYSTGSVNGGHSVGGLIGYNWSGSITDSYSTVSVSGIYDNVGGLVGFNYVGGIITSSNSTGSVNGRSYVGGLVGYDWGSVTGSHSTGMVNGDSLVGGLVGKKYYGNISSSYSTSFVNCTGDDTNVGGLVGVNDSATITSSYSTGLVNCTGIHNSAGGLAGYNIGTITSSYSTGSVIWGYYVGGLVGHNDNIIANCYSTGFVNINGASKFGGLVGWNRWGSIDGSFWDIDTSGLGVSQGGTGNSTTDMQTQSTFTGWDFSDGDGDPADWMMLREGEDYPRLAWQEVYAGDIAGLYGTNMIDFVYLANYWGLDECGGADDCGRADIDTSGDVGIGDLAEVAIDWLKGI